MRDTKKKKYRLGILIRISLRVSQVTKLHMSTSMIRKFNDVSTRNALPDGSVDDVGMTKLLWLW